MLHNDIQTPFNYPHGESEFLQQLRECIDICLHCYQSCAETLIRCLKAGEEYSSPGIIRILTDCSEICRLSADFMMRESNLHHHACALCSVVCSRCAEDCEGFDDEFMKDCAAVSRKCAESCREMARHF